MVVFELHIPYLAFTLYSYYEDYLSTSFPFGSYKQIFIPPELTISSLSLGASLCIFGSHILFDDRVIDQVCYTFNYEICNFYFKIMFCIDMHMQVFLVYMILSTIYNLRTMGLVSQMIVVDCVAGSFYLKFLILFLFSTF